MKNLELLELVHKGVPYPFTNVTLVSQTPQLIYYIRANSLHSHDLTCGETIQLGPPIFADASHLKSLIIENKTCVVVNNDLFIIALPNKFDKITFDKKIIEISWNPTEELVAVVFDDGEISTFCIDYENAEAFPQGKSSTDAGIPDTVYVGWGSKDTQFRGSEGKIKDQTPVETKPVFDQKPRISWRGNGEMFVVNYWKDQKRQFIVFETPCKALYRSEECPGLQPQVAWRPVGNMIAGLSVTNRQKIVIFEKNGQRRFDFDLTFDVMIKNLKWSPCAQILAIHTVTPTGQTIHLLTSSNYKWYEKQVLEFPAENALLDFDWLDTNQLQVVTQSDVIKYTFRNVVHHNSAAICGVIDGKHLNLTDFNNAVIPPISYARRFTNDKQINFVTFRHDLAMIIDSENDLKIFNVAEPDALLVTINLKKIVDLPQFALSCHHFLLSSESVYFAVTSDESVFYSLDWKNPQANFLTAITDNFSHLLQISGDYDNISGLKSLGNNLFINNNDSILCQIQTLGDQTYVCNLTSNNHFYLNEAKISDCANSFTLFDSYLLYTTKQSELFCLRLGQEGQNFRRNVEQGATIVCAVPNSPQIVLQLPRGNLETISCRLISIDILDKLLNEQKWAEAVRFIRLEKLNANLLFDLNPERFLRQIAHFVQGVHTINELTAICLEFEEGNVLTSIYKNWGKTTDFPQKINTIFASLFKYFDSVDYSVYITTIVAVNLNFFKLRDALIYLQDLYRRTNLKEKLLNAVNTLKIYGCDHEKLYTECLLLYDLELAGFIASCCQLDPRVYEPHLKQLSGLNEVEMRYEINLFAKKPKTAIIYLLRCPKAQTSDVLAFIKTHNVSRQAFENCPPKNRFYQSVSHAFAGDLSAKGCHTEAGVVLKRAGLPEEALAEFQLGLNWRQVLNLLEELNVDKVEKIKIVNDLATRLVQSNVRQAAILFEFYADNYEMAVKVLIEGFFFEEAIHIAMKHKRGDIIVSDVIPMLMKHKIYLEEKLQNLNESYNKYKQRLAQVRQQKFSRFNNDLDDCDERDDLFSDAGSTISKSSRSSRSRSSTASSRNRRKEEKKKQDLREGGIYEDIALIRALHSTIKEFYNKGEEVRNCCVLLLQESDVSYDEIKRIHDFYWKFDAEIQNGVAEIWPPHFYKNYQTLDVRELADLENFEHLDVEFRTPPGGRTNWKLNLF
ncbi:elongator complex protein 1 [Tribolium castaneum]|uniref:Elongator complex protein 1 n=1 Tax=Tribolium castaneum TaxID=7070 RepID=D2A3X2_TRICA|nr:PREDICTED: elongator complex protein 1 [Tribolium castaneum]EFA05580.2 Putative elongator complex protein 1-like Protein [Tribolium castaneum]|eukprot:XP_970736.2 PREDICTED: elongator complex protein 1 [Tribolium castaneum]